MHKSRPKNLLILGASSKLALRLQEQLDSAEYTTYLTYRKMGSNGGPRNYCVDFSHETSVTSFLNQVSHIDFDAVIFFASTYDVDNEPGSLLTQYKNDFVSNALHFAYICKGLKFSNNSVVIVFGDSGITQPKKGFSSYSLSKLALENIVKILAVELAPKTTVNAIRLGPTLTANKENKNYYRRFLLEDREPAAGLLSLITFMLKTNTLNMTGAMIDYDGGAYLIRG